MGEVPFSGYELARTKNHSIKGSFWLMNSLLTP